MASGASARATLHPVIVEV